MLRKTGNLLFLVFVLAAILRLVGVSHGFPFIFHPDEPTIIRSALGVRFSPNPAHFDWPHLYVYLNYFIYMGFAFIRGLVENTTVGAFIASKLPIIWNDNLIFYLLTRILTAIIGALTVYPVYLTAKRLFDEKVALLSAFTFAILPFHISQSHRSLPDVPMIFFLSWGLYYASVILVDKDISHYQKSGFFAGIAASTKYNGGLSAFTVPLAHLFRILSQRIFGSTENEPIISFGGIFALVVSGVFAVIGFLLGTPYALLDYKNFLRTDGPSGALWQFVNVGSVSLGRHIGQLWRSIVVILPDDLGYTVIIGLFLCLGLCIVRFARKKATKADLYALFLILPAILEIYYIAGFQKFRSQYFMIMYPFAVIAFSYFVVWAFSFINKKSRAMSLLFLALCIFPPAYSSVITSYRFYRNDTRIDLYKWGQNYISSQDLVYYDNTMLKSVIDTFRGNHKKFDPDIPMLSGSLLISTNKESPVVSSAEILNINSDLRLGSSIKVYKIL